MTPLECCRLVQDVTRVPVSPLENDAQKAEFCAAHQIHPVQEYLLPHEMEQFLASLQDNETVSLADVFRVRFLFFRVAGLALAMGPFCTEFFTETDCRTLLRQVNLTQIPARDLFARRGQIVVASESQLLHVVRCIDRAIHGENRLTSVRRIEYDKARTTTFRDAFAQTSYTKLVQERYRTEEEFLDAIRHGDVTRALDKWHRLHQSVAFMKRLGQTMETARVAAAVTRTTIRMAAAEVGVPALVNDAVTGESSRILRHATSIEQVNQEHERLIREYCQLVRRSRSERYTSLVQSVLYCLDKLYDQPLTVTRLARELEVSPNHLTTEFHRQTGQTFTEYLTRTRVRQARALLVTTDDTVQAIAAAVGVPDANYFIKLFKRAYGQTPAAYRRCHKI
ncbi:MAG: helix-turn-helix transcriptional regulator [Gemmiger sp.]